MTRKPGVVEQDLVVLGKLGKEASGRSYLGICRGTYVVLKERRKDERAGSVERLIRLGLGIPKSLSAPGWEDFAVREFVSGSSVSVLIAGGFGIDGLIATMLAVDEACRLAGVSIDYFPTNFVLGDQGLFYLDYEVGEYSEERNFRNREIYYWLNSEGMRKFLQTEDRRFIDQEGTGPLIREDLRAKRQHHIDAFERGKEGLDD